MDHVDLNRRFRDLTEKELEDPSLLAMMGASHLRGLGWEELLLCARVILLAEAGSGKTSEMRACATRLTDDGKSAFFRPIEHLHGEDLRDVLAMEPGEAERFDAWLADGSAEGWFFLDAVDELKLAHGKLDAALGKLARALGPARNRAHIIVSCRPTDWRPVEDMRTLERRLPPPMPPSPEPLKGDAAFLAALERRKEEPKTASPAPFLRAVVLLPLGKDQIRTFAAAANAGDVDAFLDEIEKRDAWSFARRPLDLGELVAIWRERGRLGSLLEQHEADIQTNLRDVPDRRDSGVLSADKARGGAARLALAMTLTGCRTLRAPERAVGQDRDAGSLDAALILTDWSDVEIRALLTRPIFDPATYGRVRFHHRSVQEFLAAERLSELRKRGMTARRLNGLLFAELYGERIVIPSMRPIASWLACADDNVCREVLAREPEDLILFADPESLPLDVRTRLLQAMVRAYGPGDWRGIRLPRAEVQRLAQPDLAATIRSCWETPHTNDEVNELLLELIWLGSISACVDIARVAALDPARNSMARSLAIRALRACGQTADLRTIADGMLTTPDSWPDRVIYNNIDQLYPAVLSIDEVEILVRRTPEPPQTTGGFAWNLFALADELAPLSPEAVRLRDMLARLVWETRAAKPDWYNPTSRFAYLTPALARLCERQLAANPATDRALVRASVIANRFHGQETLGSDEIESLKKHIAHADGPVRSAVFLQECEFAREQIDEPEGRTRVFAVLSRSILPNIFGTDWPWLLALLEDREARDRDAILDVLLSIWHQRGRTDADLQLLRAAAADAPALTEQLDRDIKPREPSPQQLAHDRKVAALKAERRASEERDREAWTTWKAAIEADPDAAFEPAKRCDTVRTIVHWIRRCGTSSGSIAEHGWRRVRDAFSAAIAERFEAAMRAYWRTTPPPLRSGLTADDRDIIGEARVVGLTALLIEAGQGQHWSAELTPDDAMRAAGWGTLELNGFPEWYAALAAAQPDAVAAVLRTELDSELARADTSSHPHVLSALEYGDDSVRRLMTDRLKEATFDWPQATDPDTASTLTQNLARALSSVVRGGGGDAALATHCEHRFIAAPKNAAAAIWLEALAAVDLQRAAAAIRTALEGLSQLERAELGVAWIADLFGRHSHTRLPVGLEDRAAVLVDLARLAYGCVRREDDIVRQGGGAYTPTTRDDAETGRSHILNALLELPGAEAHAAMLTLADDPLFEHVKDRLRIRARERAAIDSEPAALSVADAVIFDRRNEAPPKNADELFRVMLDRLDDIDFDLHHHDFNDRHALRAITKETDMQPVLARKLEDHAREAYRVSREEEVADKKKTDIRLAGTTFPGRAVLEVKIADNWSVRDLENALTTQLVGQYLRHPNCSVGCLLLTYAGRKGFDDPDTGRPMSFVDVVARLKARAAQIETDEHGRIRLAVIALDLRETPDNADGLSVQERVQ